MIRVKDLTFRYQRGTGEAALRHIFIEIGDGEFVAIVGTNGCGKTTFMRHFNALNLPTSDKVLVDDMDTANPQHTQRIQALVGMVFQDPKDQLVATTVEEDVAFGLENLCVPTAGIRRRVDEALKWTGMKPQ